LQLCHSIHPGFQAIPNYRDELLSRIDPKKRSRAGAELIFCNEFKLFIELRN
jgi:hypothetical protein